MLVKNYIDQFTLCAFLVHDPQTSVLDGLVLRSVCDIFRIYLRGRGCFFPAVSNNEIVGVRLAELEIFPLTSIYVGLIICSICSINL